MLIYELDYSRKIVIDFQTYFPQNKPIEKLGSVDFCFR